MCCFVNVIYMFSKLFVIYNYAVDKFASFVILKRPFDIWHEYIVNLKQTYKLSYYPFASKSGPCMISSHQKDIMQNIHVYWRARACYVFMQLIHAICKINVSMQLINIELTCEINMLTCILVQSICN